MGAGMSPEGGAGGTSEDKALPLVVPALGCEGLEVEAKVLMVASELDRLCALRLSVIWRRSEEVKVEMVASVALTLAVKWGPWESVRSGGAGAGEDERLCLADEVAEREDVRSEASAEDGAMEGKATVATWRCCEDEACDVCAASGCDAVTDAVGLVCEEVVVVVMEGIREDGW